MALRETLRLDIRYALRQAWKNRSSALASFLALAVGIGATTAMFTLVSGVLLRPLPVQDAARLVRISEVNSRTNGELQVSMSDFVDWTQRLRAFSAMTLYRMSQGNLTSLGPPERVRTLECDTNMLPLLGITPIKGRNFGAEQREPGRAQEALLTWSYWQSRFGGQDVIGRRLIIDDKSYTVVGILPNLLMMFGEESVWLPLEFDLSKVQNTRGFHWYYALGRLRPGTTLAEANRELSAVAASLAAAYPTRNEAVSAHARDFRESITGNYRLALLLLFGFVVAVLFIACANVASLSLARASSRQREISIRVALGATRLQLFRQLLTESILLSCASTVAGVLLAALLLRLITKLPFLNIPLSQNIQIDARVLLFSTAVAVLTGLGFGFAPAWRASLIDVADALKQSNGRTTDSRSQQRLRRTFVVIQSAIATSLLVICGLLLRSFVKASQIDLGFNVNHLLTLNLSLPPSRLDAVHPGNIGLFARNALARIREIPGVEDAAIASELPLTGTGGTGGVLVEGKPQPNPFSAPYAQLTLVSPDYFHVLRIPLLRGREFGDRDNQNTPSVAIVNQAFVKHFLPSDSPLLQRIALAPEPSHWRQIVGVVGDIHQLGIEKEAIPQVFFPIYQLEKIWLAILVRTQANPMQYVAPIRGAVQKVDPQIAVFLPGTMEQIIAQQRGWRVFETSLVSGFAGIAVLLATFGTYAVVSYSISQRVAEIGIRMALGATSLDVLKDFVIQGAAPAILGAAVGIVLAIGAAKISARLLYGIAPEDPLSFAAALLLLVIVAIVASYIPARRAALLDPSKTLRNE